MWFFGGIVLLLAVIVGGGFWFMLQPLYRPGSVRNFPNLEPPQQPPSSTTWLVEPTIELAHFSIGTGRNIVVLHGGPGHPFAQPIPALNVLTGTHCFHYYDQRGSGNSTRPIDRFSSSNMFANVQVLEAALGLGAQIADIERVRRLLQDEQVILLGHSWGGFLAALYAAEFPSHVAALILVSPASVLVMPDADPDLFASVRARLPTSDHPEYDAFMAEYLDFSGLFSKSEDDLVGLARRFGEYYERVVDMSHLKRGPDTRPGGWMAWAQFLSMGARHDFSGPLKHVEAPALVIHGANDLQTEASTRLYASALGNAEYARIEDASHFPHEEQPEEFARLVDSFLKAHSL